MLVMDYIKYDRLYSTNEFVVLFCGTGDAADSLDARIRKLNDDSFQRGTQFKEFTTKPHVKEEATEVDGTEARGIIGDKSLRVYTMDLSVIHRDRVELALDMLKGYLEQYARQHRKTTDARHNLPIHITAEIQPQAEDIAPVVREELKRIYEGSPELRELELKHYITALRYLAAVVKPANIFVLDREHKQYV